MREKERDHCSLSDSLRGAAPLMVLLPSSIEIGKRCNTRSGPNIPAAAHWRGRYFGSDFGH